MEPVPAPSVLFVYYSYTNQTLKLVEAMADVLRERGCDVATARIELTDPRYAEKFSTFPMKHPLGQVIGMLPTQLRRKPVEIRIPDVVTERHYDLVCIGSPTWWLKTNAPIRAFLGSDEAGKLLDGTPFAAAVPCRRYWKHNLKSVRRVGVKRGGRYVDGIAFRFQGGQVRSLLSLISYFGSGEYRERYLGLKIPPSNLQENYVEQAGTFAGTLADGLLTPSAPEPA